MHCIMHAYIQVRSYHKGDSIIKKGTIGTTMFFIDLGSVRAEIRGQSADELKSGDYFGEIAFVATCKKLLRDKSDSEPPEQAIRVADVVALTACRLFELSVKDFITALEGNASGRAALGSISDVASDRKAHAVEIEENYTRSKQLRSSKK